MSEKFARHRQPWTSEEVGKLQDKKVPLPGGGSLIIEQTEALVAIDVNSGTFRVGDDAEETAYQTNLQAAKEIARQLRLLGSDLLERRRLGAAVPSAEALPYSSSTSSAPS